ncbi:restriction endonuclease subunit S [Vibrio fluvialis]
MTDKQTVKFGDICKEVKLTTKDPIGDGYERYVGLEHLDSGSLKITRWGMIAEDSPSFTRVFKKGQILFGKRRPYLKKAAIAEFDGICSGDIIVMEVKGASIISSLLPFIVQSEEFWAWAIKNSSGSLSPRTKFKSLADFTFRLSEQSKQQSCCLTLGKVEEVMQLTESLSHELLENFRLVLDDVIAESDRASFTLAELGKFYGGGTPSKSNEDYWKNGTIPWISPKDMSGVYINDSIDKITQCAVEQSNAKLIDEGSILFVTRSGILRHTLPIALATCELTINQDLKAFKLHRDDVDVRYLFIFLWANSSKIRKECMKVGTTVESIDFRFLKSFKVEIPCVNIQRKIVELFESFLLSESYFKDKLSCCKNIRSELVSRFMR